MGRAIVLVIGQGLGFALGRGRCPGRFGDHLYPNGSILTPSLDGAVGGNALIQGRAGARLDLVAEEIGRKVSLIARPDGRAEILRAAHTNGRVALVAALAVGESLDIKHLILNRKGHKRNSPAK